MNAPPFDRVAGEYDAAFTHRRLGRWLRSAVWAHLEAMFRAGDHVLDLGCGTGEDALQLAERGVRVCATDASPGMLDVARRKAEARGLGEWIDWVRWDLTRLDGGPPGEAFDGAFSNFGALNCLPDRRPLAAALAPLIRPGGRVVLVVMGPFCPWEWGWYLGQGRMRTALRRFRPGAFARLGEGATVRVWYPSPARLRREFDGYFRHVETRGIGVFLPPSFGSDVVERWPGLFEKLAGLERRAGRRFPWTWLNDHYLMCLERTA